MILNFFLSVSVRGGKTGSVSTVEVGTGVAKGVAVVEFVRGTLLNAGSGFMGIQLSSRDRRGAPVDHCQIESFLETHNSLTSNK